MASLLRQIANHALATGNLHVADIQRLRAYNTKHPMWRVLASDPTVAAYDAIMAQAQKAAA